VTAGLGAAFFPSRPLGAVGEPGIPISYLETGLAALANTWRGYWGNGHYGAAVIAAYFFAREADLDEPSCRAIRTELDAFQEAAPASFDFDPPKEEATPERVPEIAKSLEEGIDHCRGAGHDVIFASLAMKAFRHAPALAKPTWIDGILELDRHLREHFSPDPGADWNRAHPLPVAQTPQEMLESAFACFERVSSFGAVGMIHAVTHADAVAELWEMGYESLGERGSVSVGIHVNLDPAPPSPPVVLAAPSPESPLEQRFWENPAVRKETWGFRGHTFKFPYSYYRRRGAIRDADLRKRCDERARAVLGTVLA
jgi:hypothetical protein